MSNQDDSLDPFSKRRKCGDGDGDGKEAADIIAFGGPMYDEATARKMLQEVVLMYLSTKMHGAS